jgi:phosphoglucosamine mutase
MKYFGTDGFRGRANAGLTGQHAFAIGRYVGWYYGLRTGRKARVVVGKDTRRSSYMFEYAIASGLVASGADGYLLHVTPTPSVSYVVRDGGFDCGVMITASHNPYQDNGIKLVNREGFKMEPEVLQQIEDFIDEKLDVPLATGDAIGRTIDHIAGRERYLNHLISTANFRLDGMKIGIDCANGASWTVAERVFRGLVPIAYVINDTPMASYQCQLWLNLYLCPTGSCPGQPSRLWLCL